MSRGAKWLARAVFSLILAGFSINALLLGRRLAGGGLAGCGGSCEDVLSSRWSQLFGVPVTAFGLLVYAVLMLALVRQNRRLVVLSLGALVGAAGWFILVQALMLGRFCPWCMAAHGVGAAVAVLVVRHQRLAVAPLAAAAVVVALVIGLLQSFGPSPAGHRVDDAGPPVASSAAAIHARGGGRKVEFAGGRKVYDLAALPHLGRTDARWVLVEYFDYSCAACRTMRGYLNTLMAKHPDDFCVVLMPVPLERSCNPSLAADDAEHPGSCELARLALAVWRTKPAAFGAFHEALLAADTSPESARARARQLIPSLDTALRDPWIDELLQADIADWVSFSAKTKHLPKLLVTGKRILHGLPSGEADFIRVMEQELGL